MKKILLLVLGILFLTQISLEEEHKVCPLGDDFLRSYIGLALSPFDKSHMPRKIKIIWVNERLKAGDQIALFAHTKGRGFERKYVIHPSAPQGTEETGFEADFSDLETPLLPGQCKKYYVFWLRDGHIRDVNCLRDHSTWMYDMYYLLGDRTLADIFIPGTHNSGAYKSNGWRGFADFVSASSTLTQDSNIMGQLMAGVRYIHVKVGYHPGNEESVWWVHKNSASFVKLDTVIEHVKTFLNQTREIVIFDVEDFPVGFDNAQTYEDLLDYLSLKLEKYAGPNDFRWNDTLYKIWSHREWEDGQATGKVILNLDLSKTSLSHRSGRHGVSIKHSLTESNNLDNFFTDLDEAERRPWDPNMVPHATFVELAASDLRAEADRTNADVTIWYHTRWYQLANIVAVDFLESSGIVDVAIRSNKLRFGNFTSQSPPPGCVPPFTESNDFMQYRLQKKAIQDLLYPRIVDNAAAKIYRVRTDPENFHY